MQYNQLEEELSISEISNDRLSNIDNDDSSDLSDLSDLSDVDNTNIINTNIPTRSNQQSIQVVIYNTIHTIYMATYEKHSDLFNNNVLNATDLHTYNKFIVELPNALDLVIIGAKQYSNYELSYKLIVLVEKYTSSHVYDWHNIVSQTDYNLEIFRKRSLPYFTLESKDWVKSNIDAKKSTDYPNIFDTESELHVTRNNNFLSWQILPIDMYNIDKQINLIKCLYSLNLKRHALLLFTQMLQSPITCHICKEQSIWLLFTDDLKNTTIANILAYSLSYAMYIFRQEETIMFTKVNDNYRVLFTLEQALGLPVFNLHIEQSPYILTLTDNTRLSSSMIFHLTGHRRLCTETEFKRRFRLATGGAFNNIDLESIGAAITGSILVPCVHISPLEKLFSNCQWDRSRSFPVSYEYMVDDFEPSDVQFLNYLEYYYPSYCSLTDEDYCKTMNIVAESDDELVYDEDRLVEPIELHTEPLVEPSAKLHAEPPIEPIKLHTEPIKPSAEPITEPAENKSSNATEYNQLADIDISITTKCIETFKERVYILYNKIVENCKHRGPIYITCIKTIASIKYKIYGPGVPRPMDVFRISYTPAQMVNKFHLHVVKMYYNNTLTLFRSCISCLLSGVSESYKWFTCKKIPADVLLKYAQRGFTTVLNQVERETIANYIMTNDRYSLMIKYLQINPNDIYCCVNNKHAFFKPSLYSAGIRLTLRNFALYDEPYNRLVIGYNQQLKSYGMLEFKDINKIYKPNQMIVLSALNHINYY